MNVSLFASNRVRREYVSRAPVAAQQPMDYNPLVPLNLSGEKTPLFAVHPGTGATTVFTRLAPYFAGERAFFGLRTRGLHEGEAPFTSLEEMVSTYVRAIRRWQPHGPYALMGFSYGGPVAFEIAKRLESRGERVPFLGSIASPPYFLYLGGDPARLLEEFSLREPYSAPPPDAAAVRRQMQVARALISIARSHLPCGAVNSVTVFRAMDGADSLNAQLKAWSTYIRTPVRTIDVPGSHHELMSDQHVEHFQRLLRAEVDLALGAS